MTSNDMIWAASGIVAFLVVMLIYLKRSGNQGTKGQRGSASVRKPRNQKDLEAKLLNMVFGDRATANRLINYEKNKNPTGSEENLIRSAIDRLKYDRR